MFKESTVDDDEWADEHDFKDFLKKKDKKAKNKAPKLEIPPQRLPNKRSKSINFDKPKFSKR